MKKFTKIMIICLVLTVGFSILIGCKNKSVKYRLDTDEETFYYGDFYEPLEFPSVKDRDDNLVSNDRLEWSIESGDTAILSQDGQHFELYNKNGKTIFFVVVDNDAKHTLKYTVNVVEGSKGSLNSSLSDANYSVAPGIAKRRVFGNKDIQNGNGAITQAKEIIRLRPGFEDVSVDEYNISITDENYEDSNRVIEYNLLSSTQLELTYKSAGVANLKVELNRPDEVGIKPFFVYSFNVVDGVNVYDYQDLKGVQDLVTYNQDSNKYTYNEYTGWDGTKFENIVLRNNIQNIDDITLFYGSVYGNGYQLDATPYADSQDNNHPNKGTAVNNDNTEQKAFYLMSDNTVLDNISLVGYGNEVGNLNSYYDKKVVLGVYGVIDTVDKDNAVEEDIPLDTTNVRQPENIKIINSIIEKGRRAIYISGAPNPNKPILIESCVIRSTGDHGVWLATDWKRIDNGNDGQEYRTYVNMSNNIMADNRFPAIGIQNGLDKRGIPAGTNAYGTKLTVTGDKNYIFNWTQISKMDFGSVPGVGDLAPYILTELQNEKNKELYDRIVYSHTVGSDENDNLWFNLSMFGNFRLITSGDVYARQNSVDYSQSNLNDFLIGEEFVEVTVKILAVFEVKVEVALYFADKNIPKGAPRPEDDLSIVVPQRISEIVPANA